MSTNFQYRLQQYESVPPAESWNKIADRLDDEYNQHDITLSERFTDFELAPPAVWNKINAALDTMPDLSESPAVSLDMPSRRQTLMPAARVIPLRIQKIAAVLMLCLTVSALYYFMSGDRAKPVISLTNVPVPNRAGLVPSLSSPKIAREAPVPQKAVAATRPRHRTLTRNNGSMAVRMIHTAYNPDDDYLPANSSGDIRYAPIDNADQPLTSKPIAIPTQPIRDGDGNIIMDEKLISAADDKYVTVTGPNGEQTKISKKFIHALSYMNAGSSGDDNLGIMLHEGSLWKWLFQEWRQKLLSQSSFIPGATNFLDILELKEILHENL
jgi:hypothetical protein